MEKLRQKNLEKSELLHVKFFLTFDSIIFKKKSLIKKLQFTSLST